MSWLLLRVVVVVSDDGTLVELKVLSWGAWAWCCCWLRRKILCSKKLAGADDVDPALATSEVTGELVLLR